MNIFLITLLCYLFPFGPAELFQPSNNLTKCNVTVWAEPCNNTITILSNKSNQEDPWAGNLFRNKSNAFVWDEGCD